MDTDTDYRQTLDIRELKPKLRNDVECSLAGYGAEQCYIVEDLSSGRFFRIGFSEYALISLFDGHTTLGDAVSSTATALNDAALTENEATIICKWLMDSGLAVLNGESERSDSGPRRGSMQRRRLMQAANPISPRIALFNPDNMLQMFHFLGTLICSSLFAVVWLCVVGFGTYFIWVNFDTVAGTASFHAVSPHDIAIFAVVWCVLKLLHESGHALACHHYGGRVVEAGIMFILLIPLPYVDVTSSWRMRSKWKRIFVAAAGMYLELLAAAVASCVLHVSSDPVVLQVCRYVIFSAGLTTLLFNANPLMKFDGYYILSDFLNLPNLAAHGQQLTSWVLARIFFGPGQRRMTWPEKSERTIFAYGIGAALWRILITISLAAGAALLLRGAGIVMAAVFVLSAVGILLFKFIRFFFSQLNQHPIRCVRCITLTGVLALAAWYGAQLPMHKSLEAAAVVDFQPLVDVRSRVHGFVSQVHVTDGEYVKRGQLLITLNHPELDAEIQRLSLQLQQSHATARMHRINFELAAAQVEERNIDAMSSRLNDLKLQQQDQKIRAPSAGTILDGNLTSIEGQMVVPGQKILTVGDHSQLVLKSMIAQHHVQNFRHHQGQVVAVHIHGSGPHWNKVILNEISPQAQTRLPHAAFSAQHGGDVTVVHSNVSESNDEQTIESAEPHFLVQAKIPSSLKHSLHAGQRATISLQQQSDTIASTTLEWCKRIYFKYLVTRQHV